jgi:1,4-dihydroxy-2-naphthoyl-CoA synthase
VEAGHRADELAVEVEVIQGNLGELVTELDQRRHALLDVRRQLRRHPLVLALAAAGAIAAVGGTIALVVRRRRRRRSLAARWGRLRAAVARIGQHPERVARRPPGVGRKIAGAGGSAMASVLGRRVAKRLFGVP